jgi:hypothetical protein
MSFLSSMHTTTDAYKIPQLVTSECYVDPSYQTAGIFGLVQEFGKSFLLGIQCDQWMQSSKTILGKSTKETCCFKFAPILASDSELNDETWNFLSQGDNFRAIDEILHRRGYVPKVTARLFDKVRQELRMVAEKMGAADPAQFSFEGIYLKNLFDDENIHAIGAFVSSDSQVKMSPDFVYALNGWPSRFSFRQVSGVLAHEVAHRILQHHEKANALGDLGKIDNLHLNQEIEADLLSTTVSEYGRGARDALVNLIEKCNQQGFPSCSSHYKQHKTYPSTIQRIEYLTEALCAQYPSKNRDICPDSLIQRLGNATCPVFKKT